tara:strand:- start:379 stop:894 length:516 start_codon:yes stop_codon:yes gene_type:complete
MSQGNSNNTKSEGSDNPRSSNRLLYDTCEYEKRLVESTDPLNYAFFYGKFENCGKHGCIQKKNNTRYDVVDVESELKNITRPGSLCGQFKYNPDGSNSTVSADKAPVVLEPSLCPVTDRRKTLPTVNGTGHDNWQSDVVGDSLINMGGNYYSDYSKGSNYVGKGVSLDCSA